MEQAAAIIGISGIIILLINIANQKTSHFGSDHYFHLNLIRLIKNNRHRFITRYSNFIGNEYASYPQFFHWVFSFFNITHPARLNFFYKSVIFFLDVSFFLIFFYSGFLHFNSTLPLVTVFLYAALLFIFTPFNFVRWNSGNAGFSPRGLGVLLGRIFAYLFLFHLHHSGWVCYAALVAVAYIIFISSQFAAQYMLFFCVIYGLAFLNIYVLLIPVFGFGLFWLLHGKLALNYLKGQYQHKKIYATHFAQRFILKYRPGIWQDLVYDFWIKLKKEKGGAIPYIQTNAVVTLFWGFTILPLSLYYLLNATLIKQQQGFWDLVSNYTLFQVILVTLLIFLLTSFSKTRFLGEPERYMEFATPALVYLFMQCYSSAFIYYTIIYYVLASMSLIFISKWYDKKSKKVKDNMLWHIETSEVNGKTMIDVLKELQEQSGRLKIFSNNEEITRRLLVLDNADFLLPDIAAERTGSFFYRDIFNEQYPIVNETLLVPMIKEFGINILVIDTLHLSGPYTELLHELHFTPVFTLGNFVLLVQE